MSCPARKRADESGTIRAPLHPSIPPSLTLLRTRLQGFRIATRPSSMTHAKVALATTNPAAPPPEADRGKTWPVECHVTSTLDASH